MTAMDDETCKVYALQIDIEHFEEHQRPNLLFVAACTNPSLDVFQNAKQLMQSTLCAHGVRLGGCPKI